MLQQLQCVSGIALALVLILWAGPSSTSKSERRQAHRLASSLPVLGDTHALLKNSARLYDWLTELCIQFNGEPFQVRALGRRTMTMLSSPQAFEDVLKIHFDIFPKGPAICECIREFFGHGIFAVDGVQSVHDARSCGTT